MGTCSAKVLKYVIKQDAGLEFNVSKTSILPKTVTTQATFDVAQNIIKETPTLTLLSGTFFSLSSVLKVSLVLVCLLELMFLY